MKTPSKAQGRPPRWPFVAAGIAVGVWLIGIVIFIAAGDSLFSHLTLKQTEDFSRNYSMGVLGIAVALGLYGYLMRRVHSARSSRGGPK